MKLIDREKFKKFLNEDCPDENTMLSREWCLNVLQDCEINIKSPEEVERILTVVKNKPCREYSRIAENWIQFVLYLIGKVSIYKDEDFEEEKHDTN